MNARLSIVSSSWEAFFYILSDPKILELVYLAYLELKWRRFKKYYDVIARSDHPISDLRDFVDLRGWFLVVNRQLPRVSCRNYECIAAWPGFLITFLATSVQLEISRIFTCSVTPQTASQTISDWTPLLRIFLCDWTDHNEEKGGESHSDQTWREHLECVWSIEKHEN